MIDSQTLSFMGAALIVALALFAAYAGIFYLAVELGLLVDRLNEEETGQ